MTSSAPPYSPWKRGVLWLCFLGPFFFLSYGFANQWTASHGQAGSVVFGWERHIPFLAWTIVPYWSIDLFYGLSFLACRSARETDRHALRLLSVQIISVGCFLAFPLTFTFARPESGGVFGALFDLLTGFDQPFNQAPSLHIGLLVILWARFSAIARGFWRYLVHGWALLIGVSVLTTYQHHFLDVPTGVLAGAFSLWLWPMAGPSPVAGMRLTRDPGRRRLALRYLAAAVFFAVFTLPGGAWLWSAWPAVSVLLVAFNYAFAGVAGFQKREGRLSLGATLLLLPYLIGAWVNSRAWTRRHPAPDEIIDGLWLGRLPGRREFYAHGFSGLVDLTAELPAPRVPHYAHCPWLDLVVPDRAALSAAVEAICALRSASGAPKVLVCCALGYSRSALAAAAWLLASGRAESVEAALARLSQRRPRVVLGPAHRAVLDEFWRSYKGIAP